MTDRKFKDGDRIEYYLAVMETPSWRLGVIRGAATVDLPVIGVNYIVEDLSDLIPNDHYPYTHLTVFEVHLRFAEK